MGWEQRKGSGGLYYVQKRKHRGKVTSHYIGAGPAATAIAQEDAARRAQTEADRQQRQALEAQEAKVTQYCKDFEALLQNTLEAAGYHRPDRGRWRKRRVQSTDRGTPAGEA